MKKIEITDRSIFSQYNTGTIINSEYQFSTLFIWQHVYNFEYELYDNCIIVFGNQTNGDKQSYFPIGKTDNIDKVIEHIVSYFIDINQPVNFRPLAAYMKDRLVESLHIDIEVGIKESYSDYIYDYHHIKDYVGHSYKRKRHEMHRFTSKYDFSYESICKENKVEAFHAITRILDYEKDRDDGEYEAYRKVFDNFEALELRGGLIRINERIEAVAVGEEIGSMVLMHIRRCNKQFEGISPTMLSLLLNNEFDNSNIKIINTQDDLGNENIRRTKLSYKPIYLLEKYYIRGISDGRV